MTAPPLLILASGSPRRRELLAALRLPFEVSPPEIDEHLAAGLSIGEAVAGLATAKAEAVASRLAGAPVLAADTLVVLDGEPLGKPADAEAARSMLLRLRGREHTVLTGICLRYGAATERRVIATTVSMRHYAEAEVEASIAAGTPFDKAGGYAIQDKSLAPVARLAGCYCNVMGLPLWSARTLLLNARLGLAPRRPDQTRPVCAECLLRPDFAP